MPLSREQQSTRVPVILIVDDQEWRARSLESIMGPKGFAVVKAYTGRQAVDLVDRIEPDLVIVDFHLPDATGVDIVTQLRGHEATASATPILILSSAPLQRKDRIACFEAGAWEIVTPPVDPEEILLKATNFIAAKRTCDDAYEHGMLDEETGCYNVKGIITRITETLGDAARWKRPVACVAIGSGATVQSSLLDLVESLRPVLRTSDALGRLGEELVVLAPGTDSEGGARLASRLLSAAAGDSPEASMAEGIHFGVYAVGPEEAVDVKAVPEEILSRAVSALRATQTGNGNGQPTVNRIDGET